MTALVDVSGLAIEYGAEAANVRALDSLDLQIAARQTLAVVGESGSGKSTLGLALGRLLPPNAIRRGGDLLLDGRSVFAYSRKEIRAFRRERLGFVFQTPTAALDPTRRIGRQLRDMCDATDGDPQEFASQLLARVGFADPDKVARSFPGELSGGMAQRVVVAMAIAHRPSLVVADEPTASLDSSIRNHVLDILFALPRDIGAAVVILTHDLQSVASRCSHIAVMYGGRVVETGPREHVLNSPRHPYTAGLLAATPGREIRGEQLVAIAGVPPVLHEASTSCSYAPRCPLASAQCRSTRPEIRTIDGRDVACHHAEQLGHDALRSSATAVATR